MLTKVLKCSLEKVINTGLALQNKEYANTMSVWKLP